MLFNEPYTEKWKKLKAYVMSSLKTHGFGTIKSEENLQVQRSKIIRHLELQPGNIIEGEELKNLLCKAAACVIMKIVANQDYEFDDPELQDLIQRVVNFMQAILGNIMVSMVFAFMLPGFLRPLIKWKALRENFATAKSLREFYQVHYEVRNPN